MSNRKVPPKGNAFMNYLGVFVLFAAAIVCFVAAWFYGGNHSSFGAKPSETIGVVTRVDELKVEDMLPVYVNPKKQSSFFMDFTHVEKNVGLDALYQNEV